MAGVCQGLVRFVKQLLPPACPLCLRSFPEKWTEPFCADCLSGFRPLPEARCPVCALPYPAGSHSSHRCGRCTVNPPSFSKVYPLGLYQHQLREAIHQFKFNQKVGLDRPLAQLLNRIIVDLTATLIVPVPLHRKRLQQRSYNQALLLARELARLKKIPLAKDLLQKTVETPAQQELTARERERNLKQAFQVKEALDGERILLVDDVLTTGATAVACSRVLLAAGAAEVQVAVLARAPIG